MAIRRQCYSERTGSMQTLSGCEEEPALYLRRWETKSTNATAENASGSAHQLII